MVANLIVEITKRCPHALAASILVGEAVVSARAQFEDQEITT